MNNVYLLLILIATYLRASSQNSHSARILGYADNRVPTGEYSFSFETSDGTSREESGYLEKSLNGKSVIRVSGRYSYTGDDGFQYTVFYTADENGYKPHVTRMPMVQHMFPLVGSGADTGPPPTEKPFSGAAFSHFTRMPMVQHMFPVGGSAGGTGPRPMEKQFS